MKPKRQEDSSCVFAYYFVAALAIAAIPQERRYAGNGSLCQRVKCAHLNTTTITRRFFDMTTKGIYHTLVTQLDKLARA